MSKMEIRQGQTMNFGAGRSVVGGSLGNTR